MRMRNAHVRLVRVYFTLCHSHLTALLFISLLSFFLTLSLSLSLRSFQRNWYSIHFIFIYIDIDLILSYGRFGSIVFCLDHSSVADFSCCCCCSIVTRIFFLTPDSIQIERRSRQKHFIGSLSAFTTIFSFDDYCSI